MNEEVLEVLKNNLWDIATCSDNMPNVVPVGFKTVTEDGKLVIADVFMETTTANLAANNGRIAISAFDAKTMKGYQIQGTAVRVTEGPAFDAMAKMADALFKGACPAKGALVVTPEKIIVTTPGKNNKKVLA